MNRTWRPHQTAQQRARRKSKLDGAQIAPLHTQPSNTCAREHCQHVRLIHGYDGACLTAGCGCGEWVEP